MFLNDALAREKRIRYVCNLHEQACAIAAEGYARISGMPGVVSVTTGPGGTNAITGVLGAWLDSVPMLIISGQVRTKTTVTAYPKLKLRQLGDQETNIVDVVRPITKYAYMITSTSELPEILRSAWKICREGRPGPVWLDIPLDIQSADIQPGVMSPLAIEKKSPEDAHIQQCAELLRKAERPVLLVGGGIRNAGAMELFQKYLSSWKLPFLTSISGIDLIDSDHPFFFGRPGILGDRAANFIMQNSDLLLILGTRMGIRQIGYAFGNIAKGACRIMVDIDEAELHKPTFQPDLCIHADAEMFLKKMYLQLPKLLPQEKWLSYCREVKKRFSVVLPEHRNRKDYVSSYYLPELLSKHCPSDAIIVTGNGCAYTSTFQALPVKHGMRVFANQGCASMGYGLPAAVGAAFAGGSRMVLCITGDGSIQMNLQELQTVLNYQLPIKIFVYNNNGYLSIKLSQRSFFNSNYVGCTPETGICLPSLEKLSVAYGLSYFKLENNQQAEQQIPYILHDLRPALIEVMTDPFEVLGPKAASWKRPDGIMESAQLENLFPFLNEREMKKWMLIDIKTLVPKPQNISHFNKDNNAGT